jgi:hypothetical protein
VPRAKTKKSKVIVIEWLGRVPLAVSGRGAEMHEVGRRDTRDATIGRDRFADDLSVLA